MNRTARRRCGAESAVTEADDAESIRDMLHIWRAVYFEELGWFRDFDDALWQDDFSDSAVHLVAYLSDGEPAGTMRIVRDVGAGVPVGRFIDLSEWRELDGYGLVEFTRLMVLPRYRKMSMPGYPFGVYRALMKAALGICLRNADWRILMYVRRRSEDHSILRSLIELGFRETGLDIPDEFDPLNPPCTAVVLDLRDLVSSAFRGGSPLLSYALGLDHALPPHGPSTGPK